MKWTTIGWISYLILWIVVVAQVALTLALARVVGRVSKQNPVMGARVINPGPEIDSLIESWVGVDLFGRTLSIDFPRKRGLFLLYVSPHCGVCAGLLPSARRFFNEIREEAEGIWVMVLGSRESQIRYAEQNGLTRHPIAQEEALPPALRVEGAPFGLWIDSEGRVKAKGMADRREHLESLRYAAQSGHASIQSYVSTVAEEEELDRERADIH